MTDAALAQLQEDLGLGRGVDKAAIWYAVTELRLQRKLEDLVVRMSRRGPEPDDWLNVERHLAELVALRREHYPREPKENTP